MRISIFFNGALGVIMAIYPWDEVGSNGSSFVQILYAIGIPAVAHIVFFVVITGAISANNGGLYALYNLTLQNRDPKVLKKVSKNGTPVGGFLFSSITSLIAIVLNYVVPEQLFMYISEVATVAAITI